MRLARAAFSLTEVLVASAILGLGMLPILTLGTQGIDAARAERASMAASLLGNNALARFSSLRGNLTSYLTPDPRGPLVLADALAVPDIAEVIGGSFMTDLARDTRMKVTLVLQDAAQPGAQILYCKVTWTTESSNKKRDRMLLLSRLLLYDTTS